MTYTTTDEIVRGLLIEEGAFTHHKYLRLLHIANKGLKELTFDILGKVLVATMEVTDSLRCELPEDFIDYTFIGVIGSDGLKHTLGVRDDIVYGSTDNLNIKNVAANAGSWDYWRGTAYGLGGGQNKNGHYSPQIDIDNWSMTFSSVAAGSSVYMEYISDGRKTGGNTIVHPYAEEALTAYVYWKSIQRIRNFSRGEKADARRDYYNEKRLARARLSSFTKEEVLQQIRKSFKQSPKI